MSLIQHYREIVDQFEATARAQLGMPVRISALCRSASINQRTLLRAFHAIHGTTPHRYLRELRLTAVRQALLSKQSSNQTITQVAMGHGFRELGRFAADYRAMFGESPSDTLRNIGQ